jgi:hypothetical protein
MVLKPTNANKCIKVPYIIVYLLLEWPSSGRYITKDGYNRDTTEVCGQMPRCKILFFDNAWFKTHIKIQNTVKNLCD